MVLCMYLVSHSLVFPWSTYPQWAVCYIRKYIICAIFQEHEEANYDMSTFCWSAWWQGSDNESSLRWKLFNKVWARTADEHALPWDCCIKRTWVIPHSLWYLMQDISIFLDSGRGLPHQAGKGQISFIEIIKCGDFDQNVCGLCVYELTL